MPRQSAKWNVPLLVGEFGAYAKTVNVEAYVERQYDLLDACLGSGTQWNYTPNWSPKHKDGWNDEDYSIVDDEGTTRHNFSLRPFPAKTAGTPLFFKIEHSLKSERGSKKPAPPPADGTALAARSARRFASATYGWMHEPRLGMTELYLPTDVFFADQRPQITSNDPELKCQWNSSATMLQCSSPTAGLKKITVSKQR